MSAAGSIVDVIGNTPAVWLDRMVTARGLSGRILAKLDFLNPGFSKKDRAARGIIEAAIADGSLAPGQMVIELTSGNMGTGLAIVCTARASVCRRHVAGQLARARPDDDDVGRRGGAGGSGLRRTRRGSVGRRSGIGRTGVFRPLFGTDQGLNATRP